jgi:hypothetical protein
MAVRELARRQLGNLERCQLVDLGLGLGAIKTRLGNGTLIARHWGVYAIAPLRTDPPAGLDRGAL